MAKAIPIKPGAKDHKAKSTSKTIIKPIKRSAKVTRILKKREPQLVEFTKRILILRGESTSQLIVDVLRDISSLSKPNSKMLSNRNSILPFEDINSMEFLCTKNDCSLFALGTHSKKRPNNLILGRLFDGHLLDMYEFGVDNFQCLQMFPGFKKSVGAKPLMIFLGDQWDVDSSYIKVQNILLDTFRADKIDKISLKGMDHVISCAVADGKIMLRFYGVTFKKSGSKIPDVLLTDMGPFMDLTLRRSQLPSEDLWKTACKRPAVLKPSKVKNVTKTVLGEKLGRIHMKKQNLDKMGGRRVTALRDGKRNVSDGHSAGDVKKKSKK